MTAPGSLASDIIRWVRRIVKAPSDQSITESTILEYVNRFYIYDIPQRIQLFDLRRQYIFSAQPNVYMYQVPFNPTVNDDISYPGIDILRPPVYCDGIQIGFFNTTEEFNSVFPEQIQNIQPIQGDGTPGTYQYTVQSTPILSSFIDYLGRRVPYVIISALSDGGDMLYLVDDGAGILQQMNSNFSQVTVANAGTVDYITGEFEFQFDDNIVDGSDITFQTVPYQAGRPVITLYYDYYIKLFPVPDRSYKIQFEAQITPAQFLTTADAVPYQYMAEYIARGAARKILSDTGDTEQMNFYEPLFREQELQVLRRTSKERQTTRTPTIFSSNTGPTSNYSWYTFR